jgi:SAM-dependent methyltransferase
VTAPDLLRLATDRAGGTPEEWLTAALAGADGQVLDIRCASEHPATHLSFGSFSPSESEGTSGQMVGPSARRALGRADRFPVPTNAAGAVRAVMCLPVVEPLDGLFAELRRVLRPGGTLAALVPSSPRPIDPGVWRRPARAAQGAVRRALAGHPGFRHRAATDRLAWLFASADFAVLTDQRRVFSLPVPDPVSAASVVSGLVPAGLWPPDLEPERLRRAADALAEVAAPGVRLPVPLRLVLGRR